MPKLNYFQIMLHDWGINTYANSHKTLQWKCYQENNHLCFWTSSAKHWEMEGMHIKEPSKFINKPCNFSCNSQEAQEIPPYTPDYSCTRRVQPISHNLHCYQRNSYDHSRSCRKNRHESTLLLTISLLQSQGNLHADFLCLEQHLDEDWRREEHHPSVVSLNILKVEIKERNLDELSLSTDFINRIDVRKLT